MTSENSNDSLSLAQALIRCPSVTPEEGGALDYLESLLGPAGFTCHRLPFSDRDTPDVDNLFARIGAQAPHLCFAGHTDVVPAGEAEAWAHPPFAGDVEGGVLFGRGAVDMKGGIACFAAAALQVVKETGGTLPGSLSFLITGDEEGPAINGTTKVLEWMDQNGHRPDHCLVGEPSCPDSLGDEIKIGRRGSLNGTLTVQGTAGHVAYQQLANNPVPGLMATLQVFTAEPLDQGSVHFAPSNLEVTSIETGNKAVNVIPARVSARFNIRFNDKHSTESLKDLLRGQAQHALEDTGLDHDLTFSSSGDSFLTEPGSLIELMVASVKEITGNMPEFSTGGGTSDARFIKDYCPVIEFGHVNQTIHQTNERVAVRDLEALTAIYKDFIRRYFAAFSAA